MEPTKNLRVYMLVPQRNPVTVVDPGVDYERVEVNGMTFQTARGIAFMRAERDGADTVGIIVASTRLYRRQAWNYCGPETKLRPQSGTDKHGMWQYLARLSKQYGHAYAPSVVTCTPWPKLQGSVVHGSLCVPTPGIVAVYDMSALSSVGTEPAFLSESLVSVGFPGFTQYEYFHSPSDVLPERGTLEQLDASYRHAVNKSLGVKS